MSSPYLYGFGLVLGLIAALGAQNVHVLVHGLQRNHCLLVVATCFACDLMLINLGAFGLGQWLFESRAAKKALTILGLVFLSHYAYGSFASALSRAPRAFTPTRPAASRSRVLLNTLAVSLLNPHVYLDTLVFIGGASANLEPPSRLGFVAGSLSASLVWFSGLGGMAYLAGPWLANPGLWRIIHALAGILMVATAVFMAKAFLLKP